MSDITSPSILGENVPHRMRGEQNREKYKEQKNYHILYQKYPVPCLVKIQDKIQGIALLVSEKERENAGVDQKRCTKRVNTSYSFCRHLHCKEKGVKRGKLIFRLIIFSLMLSDSIMLNKGHNYFSKWIKLIICVCVLRMTNNRVVCCGRHHQSKQCSLTI